MVDAEAVQQEKRRPAPLLVQSDWDLSKPGEVCLCHRDLLPVTRGACCEMEAWIAGKTGPGPQHLSLVRDRRQEAGPRARARQLPPRRSGAGANAIAQALLQDRQGDQGSPPRPGPSGGEPFGLPMEPKYHQAKIDMSQIRHAPDKTCAR